MQTGTYGALSDKQVTVLEAARDGRLRSGRTRYGTAGTDTTIDGRRVHASARALERRGLLRRQVESVRQPNGMAVMECPDGAALLLTDRGEKALAEALDARAAAVEADGTATDRPVWRWRCRVQRVVQAPHPGGIRLIVETYAVDAETAELAAQEAAFYGTVTRVERLERVGTVATVTA